jgi:hypothetical protein
MSDPKNKSGDKRFGGIVLAKRGILSLEWRNTPLAVTSADHPDH